MANEEQIGFHKGSIATLLKERQELAKIVSIVDQLIAAHLKSLKSLGVNIQEVKEEQELDDKLEDLLKSD